MTARLARLLASVTRPTFPIPRRPDRRGFTRAFRTAAMCAVVAGIGTVVPALAEDYPTRPIRIVIGFTAGGPTDVPARFIAEKLSASLGKPVVVENKPGAGATLAAQDVFSQQPDGYNLLLCTYFDPVNTLLYKKAKYALSDIAPVTLIARYGLAIALSNSIPAANIQQLADYTKANPDKVNYGYLGIGSYQNMLAKRLEKQIGLKMTGIPYRGAAEAMQEIVAGRNHFYIGPPLVVMPLYQANKVKVIATTGAERYPSAPEIPTLKESGVPLVAHAWLGVCARSGTPQPVIDLLNSKIVPIINSAEYRALVEKSGSIAIASTPQEFQKVIQETVDDAAPIVQEFKLQLD